MSARGARFGAHFPCAIPRAGRCCAVLSTFFAGGLPLLSHLLRYLLGACSSGRCAVNLFSLFGAQAVAAAAENRVPAGAERQKNSKKQQKNSKWKQRTRRETAKEQQK